MRKQSGQALLYCVANQFLGVDCVVDLVEALHRSLDQVLRHLLHVFVFGKALDAFHDLADDGLLLAEFLHSLCGHLTGVNIATHHSWHHSCHRHLAFRLALNVGLPLRLFLLEFLQIEQAIWCRRLRIVVERHYNVALVNCHL